jgi:NRAMP (natural resistance-associated macrophage protein)-like metal ion transporter
MAVKQSNSTSSKKTLSTKIKRIFKSIGPGLVTGASDDDPSGIATYSQAGAQFGLATLWTAFITYPLMTSIQEMCARIGMVTESGLTTTLKSHYPRFILYLMLLFSFPAIVMNIGADIEGMGAVANLMAPKVPVWVFSILFTIGMTFIIIKFSYQKLAQILKWMCMVLLLYLVVPFLTKTYWPEVLRDAFIPELHFNKGYISILVAILGTTISPYLFYWQATMEAEDMEHSGKKVVVNRRRLRNMQVDVNLGMLFSNVVMFFIILTAGTVLFNNGVNNITSVDQAASALKPIAGNFAYGLFALGVFGTGVLAIPVLAGSLSYMFAETFGWKMGLDKKFGQAKEFYIVIIISLFVGLILNFLGIDPITGLVYTAILYGLTAPVLIAIILHIGNSKKIMGNYTNNKLSNTVGIITLVIMTAAAVALLYFQFS